MRRRALGTLSALHYFTCIFPQGLPMESAVIDFERKKYLSCNNVAIVCYPDVDPANIRSKSTMLRQRLNVPVTNGSNLECNGKNEGRGMYFHVNVALKTAVVNAFGAVTWQALLTKYPQVHALWCGAFSPPFRHRFATASPPFRHRFAAVSPPFRHRSFPFLSVRLLFLLLVFIFLFLRFGVSVRALPTPYLRPTYDLPTYTLPVPYLRPT